MEQQKRRLGTRHLPKVNPARARVDKPTADTYHVFDAGITE